MGHHPFRNRTATIQKERLHHAATPIILPQALRHAGHTILDLEMVYGQELRVPISSITLLYVRRLVA